MTTVSSWIYIVAIVAVMVGIAAAIQGRLPRPARGLMWGGVALLSVSTLWSVLAPFAMVMYRLPTWMYGGLTLVGSAVHLVAVVLLLLAIGRAARGGGGGGYPGQYPGQGQFPTQQPQFPGQPQFPTQQSQQPTQPGAYPAQAGGDRPQSYGPPGSWGGQDSQR